MSKHSDIDETLALIAQQLLYPARGEALAGQ